MNVSQGLENMKEYAIYVHTTSLSTTDFVQHALLVQNLVKLKGNVSADLVLSFIHPVIARRFVRGHINFIMGHPNRVDAKMD